MNTSYQVDSTSAVLFLLSGGGYITIVAIILSVIIALLAFQKRFLALGYLFLGVASIMMLTILVCGQIVPVSAMCIHWVRHVGQLCRIVPFFVVLWMVIKAVGPGKGNKSQAPI